MLFLSNLKHVLSERVITLCFGDVLFLSNLKPHRAGTEGHACFGDVLFLSNLKPIVSSSSFELALEICYF